MALFMLRAFSNRISRTTGALGELSRIWIRLAVTLYLLRSWPLSEKENLLDELVKATGKDPGEIREALVELDGKGVLSCKEGRVRGFDRTEALRLIDEQVKPR